MKRAAKHKTGFASCKQACDVCEAAADKKRKDNPKHRMAKPPERWIDRSGDVPRIKNVRKMRAENPTWRATMMDMSVEKHPDKDEWRIVNTELDDDVLASCCPDHAGDFVECDDDTEDEWNPRHIHHDGKAKRIKRVDLHFLQEAQEAATNAVVRAELEHIKKQDRPMPDLANAFPIGRKELSSDVRLVFLGNSQKKVVGMLLSDLRQGVQVSVVPGDLAKLEQSIQDAHAAEVEKIKAKLKPEPRPGF